MFFYYICTDYPGYITKSWIPAIKPYIIGFKREPTTGGREHLYIRTPHPPEDMRKIILKQIRTEQENPKAKQNLRRI